jgi:hypothetical protein
MRAPSRAWRAWRLTAGAGLLALYLCLLSFVIGVALERARFDGRRAEVLRRHEATTTALHRRLMDVKVAAGRPTLPSEASSGAPAPPRP